MCFSAPQFRNFKIIYRRYAGLYFCICVDVTDNNLAYLEGIHNFVEVSLTTVLSSFSLPDFRTHLLCLRGFKHIHVST